jgi:myo-inositol-1(or 4)-monophosphatase
VTVPAELGRYKAFAAETAYLAGRLTLGYFQTGTPADWKADDTPVTVADRLAEQLIRRRIEDRFPDHAIVGEEYGVQGADGASHRWFIDPIDGTKSFLRGVPLYAVLLGLEIEGRIEVGAMYFPALEEMLVGASGLGCELNGRPARTSPETNLARAYVAFTDPLNFRRHDREAPWVRLQEATYYRAGWSDCYAYLLAATGRIEVAIDPIINPHDCSPFPVIFREAGGYFGDWHGNETIYAQEGLGTSQTLLPDVLRVLEGR